MQISIKGYITSKESELFYDCADRYAYNKTQNKFAISDGVSKSFFPKIWADVLVNKWVNSKEPDESQFILNCQKDWLEQVTEIVNKPNAKWFTKNAFNRKEAGLATFVGLRFYKKSKEWYWKADALGDSFLFFVSKKAKTNSKECIALSSKKEPIIFDNFPDYLSSSGNNHKGEKQVKDKPLTSGTFYLMTDALAEWFLNEKDIAIGKISVWQDQKDFEHFVNEERYKDKLGNDDTAFLSIEISDDEKDELTYILEDVSNINELVKFQQDEIEVAEKRKEKELITQKENSNLETSVEQKAQEIPKETEIEKSKKGIFEKSKEFLFGEKENEQSSEKEESKLPLETEEIGTEVAKKNLEENKSSLKPEEISEEKELFTQDEENNIAIVKSEDSQKNETQEIEPKPKQEKELPSKIPSKSAQSITNKF
ncbi:hypothetical protein [Polaribacter sp. NJDZ03]|uniref:hypothetical protein n=1 Tax=Polaribacter sp. NJDZ03 TaxID=2855841 RepID=UPI001C4A2F14|nr:hypothetical protein [Polaribacter sp. NJDZ03]